MFEVTEVKNINKIFVLIDSYMLIFLNCRTLTISLLSEVNQVLKKEKCYKVRARLIRGC